MADRLGDYIAGSAIEIIETEKLIRRYKDKIVERVFYHGKTPEEVVLELQRILEKKRVRMNTFQVPFVYTRSAQSLKNIEAWKGAAKITEGRRFVQRIPGPRYEPAPVSTASGSMRARGAGVPPNGAPTSEGRFALFSKKITIAQTKRVVYQTIARVSKVSEGGKLSLKKPLVIHKPSVPRAATSTSITHPPSAAPPSAQGPGSVSSAAKARVGPKTGHPQVLEAAAPSSKGARRRAADPAAVVTTSTSDAPSALMPKVLVVNAKLDIDRLEALHKASTPVEADSHSDTDTPPHPRAREPTKPKAKANAMNKDKPLPPPWPVPHYLGPTKIVTEDTRFSTIPGMKAVKPAVPHGHGSSKAVEADAPFADLPGTKPKPAEVIVPNGVVASVEMPGSGPTATIPPSRPLRPTISTASRPKKKDAEVQATPVQVIAPTNMNGIKPPEPYASSQLIPVSPPHAPPRAISASSPHIVDSDAGGRQPSLSGILRHSEVRTRSPSEDAGVDVDVREDRDEDSDSRLDLHILGVLAFALLLLAMAVARRTLK